MAEPIGSLVVRIGGDATDLIDAFKRAGKATEDLNSKVDSAIRQFKALAVALEIREMFEFIKSVAEADDRLGKMSEKIGMTVEALSELKYSGVLANLSVEQLGTSLQQLAKHMQDAQVGSADSMQAFRALGIEVTRGAVGPLKATDDMLFELADKFAGMKDGAGKTALAMRLFGRAGADLIPLLNQGSAGLKANADEARKLGIVLSTEASKAASEFNDNLRKVAEVSGAAARELTGPLVKALSDSAAAFITAKKEGEGFFAALAAGLAQLLTGSDADKWNKDFTNAATRYTQALDKLDESKAMFKATKTPFDADEVKRWTQEVALAKAEVDRLQAIKPLMVPEEPKKPEAPKKDAPRLEDLGKATAEAEAAAKRMVEAEEQAAKDSREAWELYYKFLREVGTDTMRVLTTDAQELADTVSHGLGAGVEVMYDAKGNIIGAFRDVAIQSGDYLKDVEDQMYDAGLAAEAMNQEVEAGANAALNVYMQTRGDRLKALTESMLSEGELEQRAYDDRLEQLMNFTDAELEALGGRQKVEQQMEVDHQAQIFAIRARGLSNLSAFAKASWTDQTKHIIGMMAEMTAGAATQNRKMFEINKVASTANAIIKGWEAVQSAYAFGSTWGGPVGGAAMAALAVAATAANVAAITSTTFGSGTAPSVGATPAPAVTPISAGGNQQSGPDTVVRLVGRDSSSVSLRQVREFATAIADNSRYGGRIIIDESSA